MRLLCFPFGMALLCSACIISDPTTVPLICTPQDPCPSGRTCTGGVCSDPVADVDLAAADLSAMDLATTDAATVSDLAEPNGCKAGGTRLAAGVYKCPGVFSPGAAKASLLCASTHSLCSKLDPAVAATCNAQPGFFASSIIGSRRDIDPVGTGICNQTEIFRVVYGCGAGGLAASAVCSGLARLVDCQASLATWTCSANLDASSQSTATNGVLCCAN